MKCISRFLLLFTALTLSAHAQLTTITASSVKMAGASIASGTVTFYPVSTTGKPLAITAGGTLYDAQGFTANIVNGAIVGPFSVPDACIAAPSIPNTVMVYNVAVLNTVTKKSFTLSSVQGICGATWALDGYVPSQSVVISSTGLATGSSVPTHCSGASVFYTSANPPVAYGCVGGVYVQQTGSGGSSGALSYTTITPASRTNINVVGVGDSRMAGSSVSAGQDYLTYLAAQPQFASRGVFYNHGFAGDTCSAMTGRYATYVQPHKPSGGITIAYLFIEEGVNDMLTGVSIGTLETCYDAYIATAVADGFTPVLNTVYYSSALTDAQDAIRAQFNDWIRQHNYLVIDVDYLFPSTVTASSPYYTDQTHLSGPGNLLWAKETNYLWGLGKSGTTFAPSLSHEYVNPLSGYNRFTGALFVGVTPTGTLAPGYIMSGVDTNMGAVFLGSDRNCFIFRSGDGTTTFPDGCGPITTTRPQILPSTAPTCNASAAGRLQYTQGNATTKDVVQVCAHDASNVYAWRTIY